MTGLIKSPKKNTLARARARDPRGGVMMEVEREYKVAVLKHCSFGVNAQKRRATRREGGERTATATKETSRLISSPRFNYLATWVTPTPGHVSMISCKVYGSSGRSVDKFTGASSEGGDSACKRVRGEIIESRKKIDSETGCWSSLRMLVPGLACISRILRDRSRYISSHRSRALSRTAPRRSIGHPVILPAV